MQRSLFPGYSIGTDAYDDIANICPTFGKKIAVIGGKRALKAASEAIAAAVLVTVIGKALLHLMARLSKH